MNIDLYTYKCNLERIIDGDTFLVNIDLGFNIFLNNIRIRILNVDLPETRGNEKKFGLICKSFVENKLKSCKDIYIKSYKIDDFGRWLCDLYFLDNYKLISFYEFVTINRINKLSTLYSEEHILTLE